MDKLELLLAQPSTAPSKNPAPIPLRDAHARLDAAVRAAYTMPEDADSLGFLLALNLELAAKEKAGEKITPPGFPFLKLSILLLRPKTASVRERRTSR